MEREIKRVDPAAEVAGEQAGDDAEDGREDRRGEGDDERDAGAVDGAGEDVAAELVDAEDVIRGGAGGVAKSGSRAPRVAVVVVAGAPASLTTTGAKIAIRISSAMKTSEPSASLSSRKRRQNSCQGERP